MVNLAFLFLSPCFHALLLFSLLSSDPTRQIENRPYKWEPNWVLWTTLPLSSICFLSPPTLCIPAQPLPLLCHPMFSGIHFSTTPCCPRPHKLVFRELSGANQKVMVIFLKKIRKQHPGCRDAVITVAAPQPGCTAGPGSGKTAVSSATVVLVLFLSGHSRGKGERTRDIE